MPASATGLVSASVGSPIQSGPQAGQGIVAIPYTVVPPTKDVDGAPLKNFAGAMVQVKGPGDAEFSNAVFCPVQSLTAVLVFDEDGTYQFRNVPATIGSIDMSSGLTTLVYGDPSPVSVENVQCTPAAAPPIGVVGPMSPLDTQPVDN